ncbi:MAG: 23S rRNA (guanosine(2251)-2'-O)-methyltransferase RlmB [Magnetococcales bacterium]|nr:23S rRNA (guanosine(2251)-2'-O)-methyltransferase RlmB [Magnetococcales bacterium]NGZ07597.1 23S rRNA (guanosine(2251)-2'-O)-methyltransferase RlmB [Magnetococcales bacterium]
MTAEAELIFGINPVLAVLADRARPVETLLLQQGGRNPRLREVERLAGERAVRPRFVERMVLDRLCLGAVHQGVALRVGVRVQPSWEMLLERLAGMEEAVLLLLDGIEDPRNLGAILRVAEAFGVMAVVLPRDRSAPLSSVAVKASAGAAEQIDTVRVTNLARAIQELQLYGVRVFGLDGESPVRLDDGLKGWHGLVALVLGGEGKGLRRLTRERCDAVLAIPMVGAVGSLNVATAGAIALYELRRRHGC